MAIDWVEIVWTLTAILGIAGSVFCLREVWLDLHAAPSRLQPLARAIVRSESIRLLTFVCYALAGAGALFNWNRLLIIGALIIGLLVLMLNTWLDRFDRHRLLRRRG